MIRYNRHQTLRGPPMPAYSYPSWYELDGNPVFMESRDNFPVMFVPGGKKVDVTDPVKFATEAVTITKPEFDAMLAQQATHLASGGQT